MTGHFWNRRQCGMGLVSAGLTWLATSGQARSILKPQDFAAVLNLETGHFETVIHPQQGHRIQAQPGSVIKLVTAATALTHGITNPDRIVQCPGWYDRPPQHQRSGPRQRLPCWAVHGAVTLRDAIAQSCNVYFYTLGSELGSRRLLEGLHQFGFAHDLARGSAPLLATGEDPQLVVTPWSMLRLITTVAVRGQKLTQPLELGSIPQPPLESNIWPVLIEGMVAAVQSGTCQDLASDHQTIAAKTGTVIRRLRPNRPLLAEDFQSWVGAFGPVNQPRWCLVVFTDQGKAIDTAIPQARSLIQLL